MVSINNKYDQIAVIFKKNINKFSNGYVPYKVVEGYLDKNDLIFFDKEGIAYYHMIENMQGNCFALRTNIEDLKRENPNITLNEIKKEFLQKAKGKNYYLNIDQNQQKYITIVDKATEEVEILNDLDTEKLNEYFSDELIMVVDNGNEQVDNHQAENSSFSIKKVNEAVKPNIEIKINELYEQLSLNIIGQDEAIRKILVSIYKHYNNNITKSQNIFVNGKTGVGKTEIFRQLAKLIKVPIVIEDANNFTMEGYYGRDVNEMLSDMLIAANGDIALAENGILIIDEIDKLRGDYEKVSTTGVQQSLLKLIEGKEAYVQYGYTKVKFDTTKLLVGALGAFSDISLKRGNDLGFNRDITKLEYQDLQLADFIKAGMMPEFMGRFPSLVSLKDLTVENLITILTKVPSSALLQNELLFADMNIELITTDDFINEVAKKAYAKKTGARALDVVINEALEEALFEILKNPNTYNQLICDGNTVNNNKKYILRKN